jgi:hypothetical protein
MHGTRRGYRCVAGFTYTAQSILAGGTGAEPHDFTVSDNPRRPAAAPGDDFSFDR